jgi:hypothetical protein
MGDSTEKVSFLVLKCHWYNKIVTGVTKLKRYTSDRYTSEVSTKCSFLATDKLYYRSHVNVYYYWPGDILRLFK